MENYKEEEETAKERSYSIPNDNNFTEVYSVSYQKYQNIEKITPDQVLVNKKLFDLEGDPPSSFLAALDLKFDIINLPEILFDLSEKQLFNFYLMLKDLRFKRAGLELCAFAFEVCDSIENFHVIGSSDIFLIFKEMLEKTEDLETFWNVLTCVKYGARSSHPELQNQVLESGIIETIINFQHESIEFDKRKYNAVLSFLRSDWKVEGFDVVEYLMEFVVSVFSSDNETAIESGIKMMEACIVKSETAFESFSKSEELQSLFTSYFTSRNENIRMKAISLLYTVLSKDNLECIARIVTENLISTYFTLIKASSLEELQEEAKVFSALKEKVPDSIILFIVNTLNELISKEDVFIAEYKSKIGYLLMINYIMDSSTPESAAILMNEKTIDFMIPLLTTESFDFCYYCCNIFLTADKLLEDTEIEDMMFSAIFENDLVDALSEIVESNKNNKEISEKVATIGEFVEICNKWDKENDDGD